MKVNINIDITEAPYGGGNQFLKALKNYLIEKEIYTESKIEADIILFNSHHKMLDNLILKYNFPKKMFIHRIDGPMSYRGKDGKKLDKKIFSLSNKISHGQVFQSKWSLDQSISNGLKINKNKCIIHNAPNPNIFYKNKNIQSGNKIKLIASSWSNNINKGSELYHKLDNLLDFKKYEMTFVGNIEEPFKNIRMIKAVNSSKLSEILRNHDIFIFASKLEACSNSLIEALHCGLPAIAINSSSNPEVLLGSGELFDNIDELIYKIELISKNIDNYKQKIKIKSINEIGNEYLNFFKQSQKLNQLDNNKFINYYDLLKFKIGLL
jgi:glycosyltransferase involved in cell wall biosynthesis